jgi:hypothetical protein
MTESDPKARSLGYARVSTYGQTLDAQLEQLRKEGCSKIYCEEASGAQPERRELLRLLKAVHLGDVVSRGLTAWRARPSTCSLSSSGLWTPARNPLTGGALGGHVHQHRAADDRRVGRPGRRGARSNPLAGSAWGVPRSSRPNSSAKQGSSQNLPHSKEWWWTLPERAR